MQSDPAFDNVLRRIGISTDPASKTVAFLTICLVVRLLLVGVTNIYSHTKWLPYVVLAIALFATWHLWQTKNQPVWWSRKFHLVIAVLLVIAASYQILTGDRNKWIPLLLLIDVLFGFASWAMLYFGK